MNEDERKPYPGDEPEPRVLATDLDATFLPRAPGDAVAEAARDRLGAYFSAAGRRLVFLTGRHRASVERLIADGRLPRPHVLFCDVGTSCYRSTGDDAFEEAPEYRRRLCEVVGEDVLPALRSAVGDALGTRHGLVLQEPQKQGPHKLSYYCDAGAAQSLADAVGDEIRRARHALEVLWSVDPADGRGLLDVLPAGVDKGFALGWLRQTGALGDRDGTETVYAGDSRNDLGALVSGVRAILVGNAPDRLRQEVRAVERERGIGERVYFARHPATAGVLEGCRYFGAAI
jgi:HAD superfamily hydrolase (TIGR01484 family)